MIENILEYIISDVYVQLWLTATEQKKDQRTREHWRPELTEQFSDPKHIPDGILIEGITAHVDGSGAFHFGDSSEPTLSFKKMVIVWGSETKDNGDDEVFNIDRKNGPARVTLTDVKKWHHQGTLHRRRAHGLLCTQATYTWARGDTYKRAGGPYHISVRGFKANADRGVVSDITLTSIVPSWATENGRRLDQVKARDIIRKNGLKVNLLAFGNTFTEPEDEIIFLTEVAE